MRRIFIPLLCAVALSAADPQPTVPPTVTPVPAGDTVKLNLPPAPPAVEQAVLDLRAQVPHAPTVVERDGSLWWQDGEGALRITGVDEGRNPQVETVCGTVAVQRRLMADGRVDAVAALRALAPLAAEAGLREGLRLAEGPLTGLHLRGGEAIVLPSGVLRQQPTEAADRSAEVAALRAAIADLAAELPRLGLDAPARRALAVVLEKLPAIEHSGDIDDATPEFLRRVVRSGWLRSYFPSIEADDRIEAAVHAAERPLPVRHWSGPGGELAERRDAFGRESWTLAASRRSAWMTPHPEPIYFGGKPAMFTVVELAPGADPLAPPAPGALRGARSWIQQESDWTLVASWTAGGILAIPDGHWAKLVPRRNRSPNVGDWLPAHLVVTDPWGDVLALATTNGTVVSPRNISPAEGERFLAEAARNLPDAAHLDLIGQYLLRYVYDSPDPRRPDLIGNKQDKGDIHQTALQTLATTAGGMFRGDCDDLAELYETIAERQGRTAHVIGVPGHAACAWAERRADAWHVFVLQTGPALEFAHASLPEALGRSYKHFDDSDAFDANGLGVLLRFTDENQRGPWRLSYRIFEDPEYARTMIDVQKDWHFSTYQRGIDKMHELIRGGGREAEETANFRELSGLYSFTGQYALAAEFHQKAIDLTRDDPLSTLYMNVELIGHLFDAGKPHQAREVALDLLDRQIPAQEKALGPSLMQVSAQVAGVLARRESRDLALRALRPGLQMFNVRLLEALGRRQGARQGRNDAPPQPAAGLHALGDWLEGPEFDQNLWENHPALQQFRRLSQILAGTAIACLEEAGSELAIDPDLQLAARFVQIWLDRIAFRDTEDKGEALYRYATAGRAYAALLGAERFQTLLDAAPAPTDLSQTPRRRVGGLAQVMLDAGWIKASPVYWSGRLMEQFRRDRDDFDRADAIRSAKACLTAAAALKGTPLDHPQLALQAHLVGLILAMIEQDEAALRQRLQAVRERGDKDWYDQTSQWMGDVARRTDVAWFATALKAWDEVVAYKPKYFWIAWRAALNKAPRHAMMAAELAATRFASDPSFTDELGFMRKVLAQ